ncbi:chromate transporter [Acetobacteraceae bacterium H6797]|nr:chromate transporter [Acetobacteraceae bacterium H6797]
MRDNPLLAILFVFVPLSFLTVGGGQSVVSEIHRQAVEVHGWMTDGQFLDLFGLSRTTPGPGSLLVTMVGYRAAGLPGALLASVAIFLPSSLLVYGLARLWARHRGAAWQVAVERGLAPVAAGMILAAGATLLTAAEGGWLAYAVAFGTAALMLFTQRSPFWAIGAGAVLFAMVWR